MKWKNRRQPRRKKSYALEIVFEENGLKNWWTASEIVWSDPADSEDYKKDLDNACYGLGKLVSVDPVIYTAIDIASIIPKVDNIADAASLAYATYPPPIVLVCNEDL